MPSTNSTLLPPIRVSNRNWCTTTMRRRTNLLGTTTPPRTFYSRFIHPVAVVLYSFVASSTCVEGQNNEENTGDGDDLATDLVESFAGLGPYLIVASLLIFMMHYIFHPLYMTRNLMKVDYLQHGVAVIGQALDCQEKQQQQQDSTSESASSPSSSSYLVEVLYEAQEHKFGYNDRLKYRNPTAFETKRLVRRFQFTRPVTVGDVVPVLLPRGNGTQMNTRSGCPREVVERILGEQNQKLQHWFWILVLGILSIIILIAQAIQVVHYRQQQQQQEQQQDQDDDTDNNIHVHPAWHGYVAILVAIVVAEALSFLFSVDAFLKKKVKTWDACRPMVSSYEQEQRQRREAQEAEEKRRQQRGYDNPFAIPLNEFAGHARATGRQTV